MKKQIIIWCSGLLVAVAGYLLYRHFTVPDQASVGQRPVQQEERPVPQTETAFQKPKPDLSQMRKDKKPALRRPSAGMASSQKAVSEGTEDPPVVYSRDIKDIRNQLYDLNIEYVEDIELLDEIVQTGDTDAREFWGGEWRSADDFKAEEEGFQLEQNADGTYKFTPDEVTARSYSFFEAPHSFSYDQDRNEFNWDVDYYGKTITNLCKFINDETAVLMIISGRKVTTNIYRKYQPPDEEYLPLLEEEQ